MKSLGTKKWRLWMLLAAYVALLAHAFVPHHHHSDFTAYVNVKSCPHDHHDHSPAEYPSPNHSGDCETLKNILLSHAFSEAFHLSAEPILLFPEIFANSGLPPVAEMSAWAGIRLRWDSVPLPDSFTENTNRRGPPTLI